jgi:S-DNA-T family DNA segregation ATPase FtsK/SpoIIIE
VTALLREGASAGVHVVLAGDRQLLSGRLSVLTDEKLILRLPDRSDVSLAGLHPRSLPETIPDGRGFRSDTGVETQVVLLDPDPSGAAQGAALERIGDAVRAREAHLPRAPRPFRVDVLPSRLSFRDAWALREEATGGAPRPLWGMVGVGGDELTALGADLVRGAATFVVAGPPKSGRSTVLSVITRSLLLGGTAVVVATPRASPLRALDGDAGVRAVLTGEDVSQEELRPLLEAGGPAVLVVDDAEMLKDCAARDYLRDLVRTAGDRQLGIVLGGHVDQVCAGFTGWQVDLRKNRHGALLSPQSITDGDLVGVRLPRSAVGGSVQPGRALLHDGSGELVTVQVPAPPA